jgi:hypothetical protein
MLQREISVLLTRRCSQSALKKSREIYIYALDDRVGRIQTEFHLRAFGVPDLTDIKEVSLAGRHLREAYSP